MYREFYDTMKKDLQRNGHPVRQMSLLLSVLLLFLLTACSGQESRESPAIETEYSATSSAESEAPTQSPIPESSHLLTEDRILEMLKGKKCEVYWVTGDAFGPTKDVTVYNTVPLEEENVDLLRDTIMWNTLLPNLAFDAAERTGSNEYSFTVTIDGQSCSGFLGNGYFEFYQLSELPDCLAPEQLLEKLPDLFGTEFQLDKKNNEDWILYRGVLDGLPVDGYSLYCGPKLQYSDDGSFLYVSVGVQLGSPAEVVAAENLISPDAVKKTCIGMSRQMWATTPHIAVIDRAELGYYLTSQNQFRPGYIVSGLRYYLNSRHSGQLDAQTLYFLVDAETGEVLERQ